MIYQNTPVLDGREMEYVKECLEENWISSKGRFIEEFENAFSRSCNAQYGVSCSNGTTAIHLALKSLGIGPGNEVIVPDFTLIADATMVFLSGARPVMVDVDQETWCIDPERIREKITKRTKAIIVVHMYGHPCDMDKIAQIAGEHNLFIIEDAAQAHGTEYKSRPVGSIGHVGCFSFYATKTLTTGEGGMLVTSYKDIADRAKILRSHGFEGASRNYHHKYFGYNYRLTNIQAAIGLAQTERLEAKIQRKRAIAEKYTNLLVGQKGIILPVEKEWAKSTFWNYTILVDSEINLSRDRLMDGLLDKGIQTQLPFQSLHSQPVFNNKGDEYYLGEQGVFAVSDRVSKEGLCLPSGLGLREEEIEYIADCLNAEIGNQINGT